jgi:hypothetical protein
MFDPKAGTLKGKKGLIISVANEKSIAHDCAKAFRFLGVGDLTRLERPFKDRCPLGVRHYQARLGADAFDLTSVLPLWRPILDGEQLKLDAGGASIENKNCGGLGHAVSPFGDRLVD